MEETQTRRPMGMRAFTIIWFGQIVSLLGSAMTGFAVTIWVYQGTEKATALALTGFFFVTPLLLLSPIAGALVDRYDRKLMMMISDLAAGSTTVVVLLLHATGNLQVWHLFITNAINGAFQTFQWPAFSAAMTLMLPKEQYGRANGMLELAQSGSGIFAPVLAGALLVPLGLTGILIIDVVTFIFAVGALLFVHIPQPETTAAGRKGQGNIWTESFYGFRYILERPSLMGLQLVFLIGNFFASLAFTLFAAMILARTGNNQMVFGSVQSVAAIGGVAGGLAMTAWGGPKRRVHGVLAGWAVSGVTLLMLGAGQSLPVWALAGFLASFLVPIINGSNQAIWQAKVAPDVQGRVFSIRRLIAWFVSPIAALLAGPLADLLLEPAMRAGGSLAGVWGWLVGTGPGAGMALLFMLGGALATLVGLGGYLVRVVRDAEDILPDYDALEAPVEPEAAPAPVGWTPGRKVGAALAAAALAALIVGLGWLQVKVLTASDEVSETESVAVSATDLDMSTPQPSLTVEPSPQPKLQPSQTASQPTTQPTGQPTVQPSGQLPDELAPTAPPSTATAVPYTPLIAGTPLTFTLTVSNDGPSDATGVVVSDTLPPGSIFQAAVASQGSGCVLFSQTESITSGNVLLCDLGDLKNGASATITIAVKLDASTAGLITNMATVGANEPDPNGSDNVTSRENLVYAEADLALAVALPDLVIAGTAMTYTLAVANLGPMDATTVTITNELAADVTFISANLDDGRVCDIGRGGVLSIHCDAGDLASGDSVLVTVFAAMTPSTEGVITNVAQVGAAQNDLHPLNNLVNVTATIQAQANLGITVVTTGTKAGGAGADLALGIRAPETAVAGEILNFTLTITNNGPLVATGIVVDDVLPVGANLLSATSGRENNCIPVQGGTVACFLDLLASGVTADIIIQVAVDPAATGPITHTATVIANEMDPDLTNNTAVAGAKVRIEADLNIR